VATSIEGEKSREALLSGFGGCISALQMLFRGIDSGLENQYTCMLSVRGFIPSFCWYTPVQRGRVLQLTLKSESVFQKIQKIHTLLASISGCEESTARGRGSARVEASTSRSSPSACSPWQ